MLVRKDGYEYVRVESRVSCKFTRIEFWRGRRPKDDVKPTVDYDNEHRISTQSPPSDIYIVHATCRSKNKTSNESYEIQTSDDWLVRWPLPKDSVLIAAPAAARTSRAKLPDAILGIWCNTHGWLFDKSDNNGANHMFRTDVMECANRGGMLIHKDGYEYFRFKSRTPCKFTRIEFLRHGRPQDHIRFGVSPSEDGSPEPNKSPPSDVYFIHATCQSTDETLDESYESFEIQTSNGWLMLWYLPM
jgi:hypothetical protein